MLEKPDFPDEKIVACLQQEYGLRDVQVAFLPLGADQNTAVYRADCKDGTAYFVKLRSGAFDEITVTLPKYLHDQSIPNIIPPLTNRSGNLWSALEPFRMILYPFVEGRDGYQIHLSDGQWRELGAALRRIHALTLPPALLDRIPREAYAPSYRDSLKAVLERIETEVFSEPVAPKLADFLRGRREVALDLADRAERLARHLQGRPSELVLCHTDLHAGNIFIDASGALFIVDWDNPLRAPKERDLMYAGGGQFCNQRTPQEEEALFYQGYGPARLDRAALAYYRYERIIEDLAIYGEQLLLSEAGGEDREQALHYFMSNFEPGNTIEIAYQAERNGKKR
jgi:spectinomycin phosphotransferase